MQKTRLCQVKLLLFFFINAVNKLLKYLDLAAYTIFKNILDVDYDFVSYKIDAVFNIYFKTHTKS